MSKKAAGKGQRHQQVLVRKVQSAMTTIMDPATPGIDLFNMGMIYDIRIGEEGHVTLDLAFSSPGLPGNLELPKQVADTVREIDGISDCRVNVVDEPPWSLDRVTDYARIHLSVVGGSD
jgi:metal-sulfur cluster biosynthetic enzyme